MKRPAALLAALLLTASPAFARKVLDVFVPLAVDCPVQITAAGAYVDLNDGETDATARFKNIGGRPIAALELRWTARTVSVNRSGRLPPTHRSSGR